MSDKSDRSDKHCVIGAGFTGLALAAAFKRHGIAYDQLEADDAIGGNWYHGVYETVHIISSRRTTEYGDFPMPPDWPDFPNACSSAADRIRTRPPARRAHRRAGCRPTCPACGGFRRRGGTAPTETRP